MARFQSLSGLLRPRNVRPGLRFRQEFRRPFRRTLTRTLQILLLAGACFVAVSPVWASKIVLETGRILEGKLARLPSIANYKQPPPLDGAPIPKLVVMCDDGLRRYFVPARRVKEVLEGQGEAYEVFNIQQPQHGQSGKVANLGPIVRITPFDEHGRRIFTMAAGENGLDLIQGITKISPTWTQVDGLKHQWEMRIATTSIPKETLRKVLLKVINPKNSEQRVRVARLFIQMQQYGEARAELKAIMEEFPETVAQLEATERSLTQLNARQILDEIRVRADSDQHQLAYKMLRQFPIEGVAGDILASVRGLREEYETDDARALSARKLFDTELALLPEVERDKVLPARDELFARRSQLEGEEIADWLTFTSQLGQQSLAFEGSDGKVAPSPGRRIVETFAEDARVAVQTVARTGLLELEQQRTIFDALRRSMRQVDLYKEEDFATVGLPDEARLLLKRDPKTLNSEEILRLNRLLLEASYPAQVARAQFAGLTMNTIVHLEAFLQFANQTPQPGVKALTSEEKLALAISGWALGSNSAIQNLPVALSIWRTRTLIRAYLKEPMKLRRDVLLEQIKAQEGSSPETIARLLANLPPPVDTPAQRAPGFFELETPPIGNAPPIRYYVQLPPEYDPQGRYPCVVALHGAGAVAAHSAKGAVTPDDAKKPSVIDWWAGTPGSDGVRRGQSMRHGTIVIAPEWTTPAQREYLYSAREHEAVLSTLRDACRRFAIDTDKVFLSGHSMGGDAAWDIGLSHPDLWAGVIPVVGVSNQFCNLYFETARYLPFYVVGGELDGDNSIRNARDLDRYMQRGFDATFAEFLGRGHEHFSDEILNIFDWMGRRKREFHRKEFSVRTIRPFDNFFWWAEFEGFPAASQASQWPPGDKRALTIDCSIKNTPTDTTIRAKSGAGKTTIWLSPELIDFEKRTLIYVNGARVNKTPFVAPDIEVILEDARTRGDRQHPYWARLEF